MRKRLLVILLVSLIIGLSFSVTASAYYTVYVNLDSVGKLPQPIYAAGAVYFNGSIYLIGGEGNNGILNTVYVYHNGTWQMGPQLPFALAFSSVVVCDGTIFVIGGAELFGNLPLRSEASKRVMASGFEVHARACIRGGSLLLRR
jgi:Kelch motif.